MRNMLFPLPPLAEQKAIVAYFEARAEKIDAAVAKLEAEVAALKEYRERLIADVVTGVRKTPSLGNDGGKTLSFSKEGD